MRKLILAVTTTIAVLAPVLILTAGASATTGTESFTAITTNPGSGVASLIATGGFTAGGTVLVAKHAETVRFAGGKFKLVLHGPGSKHVSLNPTTCLYTKTGSGSYTLADGTGAYKGISGSGKISFSLRAAYPLVNGKCPSNDQPGGSGTWTAIQFIETASGPISLP